VVASFLDAGTSTVACVGRADNLAEGEATPRIAGMGYFTICSKSTWGGRISKKRETRQHALISGGGGVRLFVKVHCPRVCFSQGSGDLEAQVWTHAGEGLVPEVSRFMQLAHRFPSG
jgi:hypothetical protein